MNLLLVSYGDFDYDGRLRELYKVFSKMGNLYTITRGNTPQDKKHIVGHEGYLKFIKKAVKYGKSIDKIDVLVLDNRKSVPPGLIIKMLRKPKVVVQDCRELYIINDVSHFIGKVGCVFEKWGINRSDILICANQERADLMKEIYGLTRAPIVYENLRELSYSDPTAEQIQREKFADLIHEDEYRIISSSGCSVLRTNDVLVSNLDKVNKKCRLFLVGSNTQEDENAISKIMAEKNINNVEILGQVNQDELKYLISVSHIGIVNYHQKDTNNKYCASGKVYEFIYEGVPVVTTTNPPLKNMCENSRIGQADDNYADAINDVLDHYDEYKDNVKLFAQMNPVETNNLQLLQNVRNAVSLFLD